MEIDTQKGGLCNTILITPLCGTQPYWLHQVRKFDEHPQITMIYLRMIKVVSSGCGKRLMWIVCQYKL